jgi:hypothetical protein
VADVISDRSFLGLAGDGLSGGVSLNSGRRGSGLSVLDGSDLNNSGVDAAADAVLHFDVEFGDDVGLEGLVLLEIFLGRGVDNVSDVEALDGLILGAKFAAVDADDRLDVSSVVFVSAVVSSLDGHVVNYIEYIY